MSTTSDSSAFREAMEQISSAADDESSQAAYHGVLNAIGHDHSGTLRRSALPAVNDLLAMACSGTRWSADAALDVLIELTTSFTLDPEVAQDEVEVCAFKRALLGAVAARRREIGQLATSAPHERTRERAVELTNVLDSADK